MFFFWAGAMGRGDEKDEKMNFRRVKEKRVEVAGKKAGVVIWRDKFDYI